MNSTQEHAARIALANLYLRRDSYIAARVMAEKNIETLTAAIEDAERALDSARRAA